jgi:C4-dicarboxylate-specific signal transduction histidine kinase
MKESLEPFLREKQTAFVGKVTASISHEIKNSLAIIQESAGLMGDLLDHSPSPVDWPAYNRLKDIITTIEEYVQRSGLIVKQLNRFAHSMDNPVAPLELNDLLLEITHLAERFARLKGVRIEASLSSQPIHIHSDPLRIQHVVFCFIERALEDSKEGATVTVSSGWSENMVQVIITDEATPKGAWIMEKISAPLSSFMKSEEQSEAELALAGQIFRELGGSIVTQDHEDSGNQIILSLPPKVT